MADRESLQGVRRMSHARNQRMGEKLPPPDCRPEEGIIKLYQSGRLSHPVYATVPCYIERAQMPTLRLYILPRCHSLLEMKCLVSLGANAHDKGDPTVRSGLCRTSKQ